MNCNKRSLNASSLIETIVAMIIMMISIMGLIGFISSYRNYSKSIKLLKLNYQMERMKVDEIVKKENLIFSEFEEFDMHIQSKEMTEDMISVIISGENSINTNLLNTYFYYEKSK